MPFLSVPEEAFTNYLSYDTYNSQWNFNIDKYHLETDPGIFIADGHLMQQRYKYRCDLVFRPQSNELETFRFCRTDIITECSADWIATEEQEQCNAYTAYVCSGHNIYRNHHCFLCNNFATVEPCEPPIRNDTKPHLLAPTFSMLLDWKRLKRSMCASSEIYDPLARVCRKVFL
jgi:hypothetical protein